MHETHVCRDCGAEITIPYALPVDWPTQLVVSRTEYERLVKLERAAKLAEPPLIDGCRIVDRGDGYYSCKVHYRYWAIGSGICPGRTS